MSAKSIYRNYLKTVYPTQKQKEQKMETKKILLAGQEFSLPIKNPKSKYALGLKAFDKLALELKSLDPIKDILKYFELEALIEKIVDGNLTIRELKKLLKKGGLKKEEKMKKLYRYDLHNDFLEIHEINNPKWVVKLIDFVIPGLYCCCHSSDILFTGFKTKREAMHEQRLNLERRVKKAQAALKKLK